MKQWTYKHGENTIRVENSWFGGESLYINDELQDKRISLFGSRLWGKLRNGEEVKVSLGGWFTIQCFLFVDNKLQRTSW